MILFNFTNKFLMTIKKISTYSTLRLLYQNFSSMSYAGMKTAWSKGTAKRSPTRWGTNVWLDKNGSLVSIFISTDISIRMRRYKYDLCRIRWNAPEKHGVDGETCARNKSSKKRYPNRSDISRITSKYNTTGNSYGVRYYTACYAESAYKSGIWKMKAKLLCLRFVWFSFLSSSISSNFVNGICVRWKVVCKNVLVLLFRNHLF